MYCCESWTVKKAERQRIDGCLQPLVLQKTPKSHLESKEITPVNFKGDQPWIFPGRTDAEAPIFWYSDENRWPIGKVPGFSGGSDGRVCLQWGRPRFDPWVRKIPWRRKWQPTPVSLPGKVHGWRSLAGYSPWAPKESDTAEQLHFHFLMLGKIEGRRRRGAQRMRCLDGITNATNMNLGKLQEMVRGRKAWQSMGLQRVRHNRAIEQQQQTHITTIYVKKQHYQYSWQSSMCSGDDSTFSFSSGNHNWFLKQ